ncbi:MAG: FxsA family protein [Planctomycetes bacterium]|nr:FxsA family protein [Planctomycetota bacterium]
MLPLFLLFTLMPLLELWLLFQLSGKFGFLPTVAIVLLTGVVGASLARWQGWQAMSRIQNDMRQGILPTKALGDGVLILVAGVLLITPGVITDVVGLSLLIPPLRAGLRKVLQLWFVKHVQVQTNVNWQQTQSETFTPNDNVVEGHVVDSHVVDTDQDGPAR